MTADLKPRFGTKSTVDLYIRELSTKNLGPQITRCEFWGYINNGFYFDIQIANNNFVTLSSLARSPNRSELLSYIRHKPVEVEMRIRQTAGENLTYPRAATRIQKFYLTNIYSIGEGENDFVHLVGVDKFNWMMNIGDAWGGIFEGNISEALRQLTERYAPGIEVEIAESDDEPSVWPMLRRKPKEMFAHLISMTSALSSDHTPWIVDIDYDNKVYIAPISKSPKNMGGYYSKGAPDKDSEVMNWESLLKITDSHHYMGVATSGVGTNTGNFYDPTNTEDAVITDSNTTTDIVTLQPDGDPLRSTLRPTGTFNAGKFGRTFVDSPVEITHSDIGIPYREYFNAYARNEFFRKSQDFFTLDLEIMGHGIWDTCRGLGAKYIYLDWPCHFATQRRNDQYFLSGNWIVNGFKHYYLSGQWTTTLHLAKSDSNSTGIRVGLKNVVI